MWWLSWFSNKTHMFTPRDTSTIISYDELKRWIESSFNHKRSLFMFYLSYEWLMTDNQRVVYWWFWSVNGWSKMVIFEGLMTTMCLWMTIENGYFWECRWWPILGGYWWFGLVNRWTIDALSGQWMDVPLTIRIGKWTIIGALSGVSDSSENHDN